MRAPAGSGASSYPCCSMEDVAMRTFDFSPFARSAIGFETLFDRLSDWPRDTNEGYPPYDIVRKEEGRFQINIAVACFSRDEIAITAEANQLTIAGKKQDKGDVKYLYQGISARSFERRFNLADYIEVESRVREWVAPHHPGAAHSRQDEAAQNRHRQSHAVRDERK